MSNKRDAVAARKTRILLNQMESGDWWVWPGLNRASGGRRDVSPSSTYLNIKFTTKNWHSRKKFKIKIII